MILKLEGKMNSKEEKIKNLEDKIDGLNKKITATRKIIPGDDAMAKAQDNSIVGVNRKLQFQKKKQAEEAEIKLWNKEISELTKEINLLKKFPEESTEEASKKPEENTEKLQTTTENIKKKMAKLSKNDILRMVEIIEPPRMTKRELIESVKKSLLKEDINDDLRRKIESGETDYSEHLNPETIKKISDDIVNDVARNFQAKTGQRVNLRNASAVLATSLGDVLQKEARNKRELEQLAIKLVMEEYNVPAGSIDVKAEITGHPQLGGREIQKTGLKMRKGTKRPPEGKTEEELKPNVTKRRLINAMIHGAARKGQNLFHMASNELNRIDPSLVQNYGSIMASNDFMYWALDDDTIRREGESGTHAGQVRVYPHGNPPAAGKKPLIEAEGITFPFLLHELTKGVIELITLWGRESDKSVRDYVEDKTDNLESETMDIRLGARIWEKFLDILDIDHLAYKAEILQKISQLPANEFSSLMNGLMEDEEESIEMLKDIVFGVIREKNEDAVEQAFDEYRGEDDEEDDTATAGAEDDDEDPILKGLISKKEENIDNPESWSKRKLEDARDEALDAGDYKAVAYLQTILDKKFG